MKSSIIHGIWGIYKDNKDYKSTHWYARRSKIDNDIKLYKLNPYSPSNTVYVFGEDNYKKIVDLGFTCKLIEKKPFVWDMEKEQYRHKMEIWKAGLQDFDSIVFLDWDTIAIKPMPDNFWLVMNEGEPIKSTIYQYHCKKVKRFPNDCRKVSSASFVYIKGIEHANGIIKLWEESGKPWKEELALSHYIDGLSGGWKGVENYKKHDVPFFQLHCIPGLVKEKNNLVFGHCNHHVVGGLIGDGKNVKDRIDKMAEKRLLSI